MGPGDVVSERFAIERLAARGGMGEVYRAVDRHTGELAALKVMVGGGGDLLSRFLREASVLSDLHHPAIVRYLAHGRYAGGALWLAMEWLEGEDLAARLAHGAELSVDEVVRMATRAAAALAAAHARRVVHRDIKPSNLFLVDFAVDELKLLDFGIARLVGGAALTESGLLVGTPSFMAPEQLAGERHIGPAADVFALGAVLYRCLSGRNPFTGDSLGALVLAVRDRQPTPLREVRPGLPAALDELVMCMLAKPAADRPADAGVVLARLLALEAAYDETRPRGALTSSERRVVSLVVVDGAPAGAAAAAAAAHDGRFEAEAGAVVLAAPLLAADLARQAASCALELLGAVPAASLALVTGYRLPDTPVAGSQLWTRARALLGAAGEARIDDVTAGLLDARFLVAGDARGLSLVGQDAGRGAARTLMGRPTSFVGREAEVAALEGIIDACAGDDVARPVLVTAPPGLGKSRLLDELATRLRRRAVEVWTARGDPVRAGAPYALAGEIIRGAAGGRRSQLRERLSRSLPSERLDPVAELLGELGGMPAGGDASPELVEARRVPAVLAERIRAAWVEWLGAECRQRPVLIFVDDLHWSDVPSLRLLDHALEALADQPLVIVGLARPEVAELFPELWLQRGLQRIHLAPLSRRASERLVRQALGEGAPATTVARVVAQAQGNAFYLEELVRHVASGAPEALPESVVAMAQSRLALLDGEARRVLRAASIFGEVCWRGGVRFLVGEAPAERLAELIEQELLTRAPGSIFPDEEAFTFRHAIVRDAAYATLTESDRALGHRLAARWLDEMTARIGDDGALARDVAHHASLAGEHELAGRAYLTAARRALRLFAPREAVDLAERGRRHAGHLAAGARPTYEVALLDILVSGGGERRLAELESELLRAIDEADQAGQTHLTSLAYIAISRLYYQAGDYHKAGLYAERAAETGRLSQPAVAVEQMAHSARCFASVGRLGEARTLFAEAERLAGTHRVTSLELVFAQAVLQHHDGAYQEAGVGYEATLETLRASHDHYMVCDCLERLAQVALESDRLEDAARRAAELREVAERMTIDGYACVADALAAVVALRSGGGAAPALEQTVRRLLELDNQGTLAYLLVEEGEAALAAGDVAAAARAAGEGLAAAVAARSLADEAVALALLSRLDAGRGDAAAARARLDEPRLQGAPLPARARAALARAEAALTTSRARP